MQASALTEKFPERRGAMEKIKTKNGTIKPFSLYIISTICEKPF